ncbi:MAG: putative glycoside hydrolase [Rikenellaceae bacterium]
MIKLKLTLFSVLLCAMMITSALADSNKGYPEFSWNTVPVALHLGKDNDFTKEEIKFIAQFPLVCFEKNQAERKYHDVVQGAYVANKAVKEINPNIKVLFYWNSLIDFGRKYKGGENFTKGKPDWILRGKDGKPLMIRDVEYVYNVTREDVREWWLNTAMDVIDNYDMDGVFIDGIHQFYVRRDFLAAIGEEGMKEVRKGAEEMVSHLGEKLMNHNAGKIVLSNNIHPTQQYGTDIPAKSNASMYEHFCWKETENADERARQIELLQLCGKQERIMMIKCWPRHYFRDNTSRKGLSNEQIIEDMKEDIVYPLACFLAGAGKYSYFCYSWGWKHNTGWLVDFPEYHKPLGEPLGDAVREGYTFTRKFKHADVWVDVQKKEGRIDWK